MNHKISRRQLLRWSAAGGALLPLHSLPIARSGAAQRRAAAGLNDDLLNRGARKLVEVNGRVRAGEIVVVATDEATTEIARRVAAAAKAAGAEVVTCVMAPRERDGQEPPAPSAHAMRQANVIYTPVRRSITHTRAMRAALDAGARAILMTAYTDGVLGSDALLKTDFAAQIPICRRLGEALTAGDDFHLTAPGGTDLRFSLNGRRRANVLTGIPDPGEMSPVPTIEVNVVPFEGTSRGRIVADCSLPYLGIGKLRAPISCTVEDGFVTRIEGGAEAKLLAANLQSQGDRNSYNIAEMGVGLNPQARLTGVMLEDEGILGTVHFGLGTSRTLGGTVVAPTHYDLLLWNPTIRVNGRVVWRERALAVS